MKDIFNKDSSSSITFLGRSGMIFKNEPKKYFIDSEDIVEPEYGVVLFKNSIREINQSGEKIKIPNDIADNIIGQVTETLKFNKLYVEIM